MHARVCMSACVRVSVHVRVRVHVCVRVCVCACVLACVHACLHVWVCACACACACVRALVHACRCVHVHASCKHTSAHNLFTMMTKTTMFVLDTIIHRFENSRTHHIQRRTRTTWFSTGSIIENLFRLCRHRQRKNRWLPGRRRPLTTWRPQGKQRSP
jgi:hypothetical protein